MDFFCDVCDEFIIPKSKYKLFKSNFHKEIDSCKHLELTIENPNKNDIVEIFYAYITGHNKKYEYYFTKCHFKLVFNDNQYSTYVKSNLVDNNTMVSWRIFFKNVIRDFKDKGYIFNHIEEMNIITKGNKMDMSYDFYIKDNIHAVEWK